MSKVIELEVDQALLTEAQVAKMLQVSERQVGNFRQGGRLGFVRCGSQRGIRYTPEQVQKFIELQTVAPKSRRRGRPRGA